MRYLLGIDIGGTKSAVCLGASRDEAMAVLSRRSLPTASGSPQEVLEKLARLAEELVAQKGISLEGLDRAGIACGGPLDARSGIILSPPNLPGWDAVPVTDFFQTRLGIPCALQNDANAGAVAEWKYGAGRGAQHMVFLTFGTGFGAGLILNGKLYSGASDMAGEVGHIRAAAYGPVGYGKMGSFEGFCSGGGIAHLARLKVTEQLQMGLQPGILAQAGSLDGITAHLVADLAEQGDPLAVEIYQISGEMLGRGLAMLVDCLNPELIVIGGIFARRQELLWPHAQRVLEREALAFARQACRVVPAQLGESTGDLAALAIAAGGY